MKKLLTLSITIILALACIFATACDNVKGHYTLKSIEVGFTHINIGEDYNGQPLTSGYVVLELAGDNTANLTIGNLSLNGTWEKVKTDDDDILLKLGAVQIFAEFDDGELEFTYLGVEYTMIKAING